MAVRPFKLPVRLGDGTLADVVALTGPRSDIMRLQKLPDFLFWEPADPQQNEYGKTTYGPVRALPVYLEDDMMLVRGRAGDVRVPMTKAYLPRAVGAQTRDRFTLEDGTVVECQEVMARTAGYECVTLGDRGRSS